MHLATEQAILDNSSLIILGIAALVTLVIAFATFRHAGGYTKLGRVTIPLFFVLMIPFVVFMSVGPGLLALFGLVHRAMDGLISFEFLNSELSNGTLALRVASLLIAYHLVMHETERLAQAFGPQKKSNLVNPLSDQQSYLRLSEAQYLFYGICAAALWFAKLKGSANFFSAVVAWALILIVDDWTIIQEYLQKKLIHPSRWLLVKIWLFNLLLSAGVLAIFLQLDLGMFLVFVYLPFFFIVSMAQSDFLELWRRTSNGRINPY
jgi:hypothetical protein